VFSHAGQQSTTPGRRLERRHSSSQLDLLRIVAPSGGHRRRISCGSRGLRRGRHGERRSNGLPCGRRHRPDVYGHGCLPERGGRRQAAQNETTQRHQGSDDRNVTRGYFSRHAGKLLFTFLTLFSNDYLTYFNVHYSTSFDASFIKLDRISSVTVKCFVACIR